ncbi:MAG: DUF58 domain-containing protein [Candidatus Sericytochromatia bacterium]|nr:DUF58 domain-containing protein [Candidatus Tanganyikabacteria bacterium]
MTGRAFVLGLIAVATFFAAVNVQAGWLYVLSDAFLGVLLSCLLLAIWSVQNLGVTARSEGITEQGVPLRITAIVENRGTWGRAFLAMLVPPVGRLRQGIAAVFRVAPHGWPSQLLESLPAGVWTQLKVDVPTPRRGVYPTPPVYVQAAPLGLVVWRRRVAVPGEVIVTPKIHHIESMPWFRADARGGEEHPMARTVPHGEMIRSTRDYRSGDPLRTIHWRGTARVGRLVVKETEGTAIAGGANVLLDLAGHSEQSLEHAISLGASILAYFNSQGVAASLVTQEGECSGPLDAQLEALARAKASDESLAPYLAQLDPAGLIVISPRDAGWRSVAAYWIQAGNPDQAPLPGAIPLPVGADISQTLLSGRPA